MTGNRMCLDRDCNTPTNALEQVCVLYGHPIERCRSENAVAAAAMPNRRSTMTTHATPLVRMLAAQRGVVLASVRGTGAGGRITPRDVYAAAPAFPVPAAAQAREDAEFDHLFPPAAPAETPADPQFAGLFPDTVAASAEDGYERHMLRQNAEDAARVRAAHRPR